MASELTEDAKVAIRNYLLKLVLPSGAVIGAVAAVFTFLVEDIAATRTSIEVYDKANSKIHDLLIDAAAANAEATAARQKVKDSEAEVVSLKNRVVAADNEIAAMLQKVRDTESLQRSEDFQRELVEELSQSSVFVSRVGLKEGLPIGTVVSSIVEPDKFLPGSSEVVWVPADGRAVPRSSKYHELTGKQNVPDFRGMFIRGLNEFDKGAPRTDGLQDPDGAGRTPGSFQSDENKAHNHGVGINGADSSTMVVGGAHQRLAHFNSDQYGGGARKLTGTVGGKESRPRNVAVYFYVKVN